MFSENNVQNKLINLYFIWRMQTDNLVNVIS
jgi:hypothetical protein